MADEPLEVIVKKNGGELTPGERFDSVERTFGLMGNRIDRKADTDDVRARLDALEQRQRLVTDEIKRDIERVTARVSSGESGDTLAGRMFLERFGTVERGLDDIRQHGSSQAQTSLQELASLESRVEQLKEENVRYNALQTQHVDDAVARNRTWTIVLASISTILMLANLVLIIVTHK